MINLLQETIDILNYYNKTLDDIIFITSIDENLKDTPANIKVTKDELTKLLDVKYDNGYGCLGICYYLKLVGKDFWLERGKYDGSEWWEYKCLPVFNPDAGNHPLIKEARWN